MKHYFKSWQEISINSRSYGINGMHNGMGIMEEDKNSDTYRFKLVAYTPGINKFGDIKDEEFRTQKEIETMFSVDLRYGVD